MHVDHVALGVEVHVPDFLQERGTTDHFFRVEEEVLQQLKFLRRQVEDLVVDRGDPPTMKLWHSADGGATWPEKDALVIYEHDERAALSQGTTDVDFNEYWLDMAKWSFGHPAIRPLQDGRVLLAHYAGTPDCMSVHWARVNTTG